MAPLPEWASSAFSEPPRQLVGAEGRIIAVPFGWPLHAPEQVADRSNKILWLAEVGGGPLVIDAEEVASGRTTSVTLPGGPGPSIVDMPAPGCWRFSLTWADQHDEVLVRYLPTPG